MTAIKIQTQLDYIPIQLGDEEFRFYITDDSVLKIRNGYEEVQKKYNLIEKQAKKEGLTEEEQIEKTKEILKEGFDFFYGEGTFERVYAISPSVFICLQYFSKFMEATLAEVEKKTKVTTQDKAKKYLANKNKKK